MLVLGIESSCDETGVALFDTEQGLLANQLHSQTALHSDYGGVVPELASRDHSARIVGLIENSLQEAAVTLGDVDLFAYTAGPGLAGALLVGASVANSLGFSLNKPVLAVHHLEGHLLSPLLIHPKPAFPFLALLVSGGHTQLIAVEHVGQYRLLGETRDDAAGEAFDKTAKLLGLGYPGGAKLAQLAENGDKTRFTLPRPMLHTTCLDFSFSGLKTAVRLLLKQVSASDAQTRYDIAAAFQAAIVEVLATKCVAALKQTGLTRLVLAGGVAANAQLRKEIGRLAEKNGWQCFYPPPSLCTDNGAMIAHAGGLRTADAEKTYGYSVKPTWGLETLSPPADIICLCDPRPV